MSKQVISAIAAIFILAAIGGGYWFWTKTPQYSLMKLSDAVHKHDGVEFQKYFDATSVANYAVTDLSSAEMNGAGGHRLLRRLVGVAINGFFKPQMVDSLSRKIVDYVSKTPEQAAAEANAQEQQKIEDRKSEGPLGRVVDKLLTGVVDAVKPPSLREVLAEMGLTRENYKGLTSFEVDGQVCHVGLIFQPPGSEQTIVMIDLGNADDHWHVIRIANMDTLARILTASPSS